MEFLECLYSFRRYVSNSFTSGWTAAISISGTDKSVNKVGIMFIVSDILENIGVVVGIFGMSLFVPEISLVMHLLPV